MTHHPEFTELPEQYVEASGSAECRITVRELCSFFELHTSAGAAFSGFLQKIHDRQSFSCRYKVARIEKFRNKTPSNRIIKKYLVQERTV
jgi:hypothetical protein